MSRPESDDGPMLEATEGSVGRVELLEGPNVAPVARLVEPFVAPSVAPLPRVELAESEDVAELCESSYAALVRVQPLNPARIASQAMRPLMSSIVAQGSRHGPDASQNTAPELGWPLAPTRTQTSNPWGRSWYRDEDGVAELGVGAVAAGCVYFGDRRGERLWRQRRFAGHLAVFERNRRPQRQHGEHGRLQRRERSLQRRHNHHAGHLQQHEWIRYDRRHPRGDDQRVHGGAFGCGRARRGVHRWL